VCPGGVVTGKRLVWTCGGYGCVGYGCVGVVAGDGVRPPRRRSRARATTCPAKSGPPCIYQLREVPMIPTPTAVTEGTAADARGPKPLTEGRQPTGVIVALWAFVIVPFIALVAAVPVAWGWGLSW